jgi:hypothetical protein
MKAIRGSGPTTTAFIHEQKVGRAALPRARLPRLRRRPDTPRSSCTRFWFVAEATTSHGIEARSIAGGRSLLEFVSSP